MKLSNLLTVKAVVSLIFGIASVLSPAALMSLFGPTLDSAGVFTAQLAGVSLIGIGLICWFNKNADSQILSGVILALFVADAIGFLVILMGQLAGQMNALGWINVAIYLAFTLGLGYFRFLNPDAS